MAISRMQEMAALGADWWNDSCDLRELPEAIARGAVGATSNPFIISAVVAADPAHWLPAIDRIVLDFPNETEDGIAGRVTAQVGREAAAILRPVAERTGGVKGSLSMQVNPKLYPSRGRMVEEGLFLASLAPNISIKVPAVDAGIAAMEELSARGVRASATVCFSIAQAVASAEAIERGLRRATGAAGIHPYVIIMTGRVDDQLKRARERDKIAIDPACIDWAGIAVFRRAARLFRTRGYRATILAAAYRHEGHWAEIIGPDVLQSVPYKWWRQFDESPRAVRFTVDDPVDEKIIAELSAKMPDFRAAYEEKGMTPPEFVRYGASVATLNQFLEGYQQLVEVVRGRMLISNP